MVSYAILADLATAKGVARKKCWRAFKKKTSRR